MQKYLRPGAGLIRENSSLLRVRRAVVVGATGALVAGGTVVMGAAPAHAAAPVCPMPFMSPVSPSSGTTAGGTSVTVTGGSNLGGANPAVTFTRSTTTLSATSVVVTSATDFSFVTPAAGAGIWTLNFATADGTCSIAGAFTFAAPSPPTASSVSPLGGPLAGGTTITITGTNMTGATGVMVGSTAATSVTAVNATTVTAVTPANVGGAKDVIVTTANGSGTKANGFTYYDAPAVTDVLVNGIAAVGPTAGGSAVVITGANLSSVTGVTIGGAAATGLSATGSTRLDLTSPAGTSGAQNVIVTTLGGSTTVTGGFTYVGSPTLTSVSPSSGSTSGGDAITLTGANLTGATSVTVGGAAATSVTVVNATSITAVTPAGTAGAAAVAVTTPGGTATSAGAFTYSAPAPGPGPAPAPEPSAAPTPAASAPASATPSPSASAEPTQAPALAPVTPPSGELLPGKGLVLEGGQPVQVNSAPLPNNAGVKLGGTDWDVSLQTGSVAVTGDPADPVVSLRLNQGGILESKGSGYLPNSQVEVYAFSSPTLLGIVKTDANGDFDGTVLVPKAFQLGGHTLQINAFTKAGKVRSVSLGVVVVAPDGKSASAPVYFKKFDAKQGSGGNRTLKTLLGTVPAGSKPTATIYADVRTKATAADKALALKRAKSVSGYLRSQGFTGTIKVTLKTIATTGTWKDRRVDSTIVFNRP